MDSSKRTGRNCNIWLKTNSSLWRRRPEVHLLPEHTAVNPGPSLCSQLVEDSLLRAPVDQQFRLQWVFTASVVPCEVLNTSGVFQTSELFVCDVLLTFSVFSETPGQWGFVFFSLWTEASSCLFTVGCSTPSVVRQSSVRRCLSRSRCFIPTCRRIGCSASRGAVRPGHWPSEKWERLVLTQLMFGMITMWQNGCHLEMRYRQVWLKIAI